jgi:ATP-dependent DNA helicase RecQ
VADVVDQLGRELQVLRGSLARPSLRIQTIRLTDQAQRLSWLAEHLPALPGSGIVYCLTVADCERVSAWLATRGIDAPAYHSDLSSEVKEVLEQRLLGNDVKALVATVALGMGYDKPDLGFVVHYQRPGSVVSYYQQIGRAGRAVDEAYAILLHGREDDEIQDYFIRTAFPGADRLREVLGVLEVSAGLTETEILKRVNLTQGRVRQCLKLLEIEGAVVRDGRQYVRTVNPWTPDEEHSRQVSAVRYRELERMRAFVDAPSCLIEFVARELDDPGAEP